MIEGIEYDKFIPRPILCHQVLLAYTQDSKGTSMLCSAGSHTPVDPFDIMAYRVRFEKFNSLGLCGQYWSQLRNRFYFHSILYKKRNASTYVEKSYAILRQPGTPSCIYLILYACCIYYHIAPKTQIRIRESFEGDTDTDAIRAQLVLASCPMGASRLKKRCAIYRQLDH